MSGGFLRRWFSEPNVPLLGADVIFRIAMKKKMDTQVVHDKDGLNNS